MTTAAATSSRTDTLSRALEALKEARQRLEQVERSRREALAIVGIGCRFPGGSSSPSEYWSLIEHARDAITGVPRDRWPAEMFLGEDGEPGKMRFRNAGFVDNIDRFDAAFFGISPREAERMDPQQRMVLQVACEALDNAGLAAESLAGSRTGVWIGVNSHDYLNLQLRDPDTIDTYTLVGGTSSIVANRLSYLLDLRGPSMAVDTACSTALVAVHLACQSLRSGECDLAIVGAVNLIISPFTAMAHARGMPLAADDHCKTFDARADGYARGEGCGVIVLRRASDAQRQGDAVWALVRGTAINQDGKTNGMTAPNGLAQQQVIRQALDNGGVAPDSIGYIEAHGTGTALGDPIEVEALQQVYGHNRSELCALGSVKPNIGHLESAAGMAGLIKVALALHHRRIPGLRGFEALNPHVELDTDRFVIPTAMTPWTSAMCRGAVSSFGAGGTNAHVVLEQGPAPQAGRASATDAQLVLICGRDDAGLRRNAQAWQAWFSAEGDRARLQDVAYTSVHRRSWSDHRLVIRAHDLAELCARIATWLAGQPDDDAVTGRASGDRRRLVFVCPGQGSQWLGMARDLLEQPVFREAIERCDAAIAEHADWSLLDRLLDGTRAYDRIDVVQPTLWAVTVALAAQWRHWGVIPDAVIGHSMGEVAAATISGALSMSDAARVICRRSKLLLRAAGKGLMLLAGVGPAELEPLLEGLRDRAAIAVCNSPGSAVASGDPDAIAELERRLAAGNVFHRRIAVDVASHSPQMDPLAAELRAALAGLAPRAPTLPMLSTVDLQPVDGPRLTAEYWVHNLRDPVRFGDATAALLASGHDVFVELSPHPILCNAMEQTIERSPGAPERCLVLPSMQRDRGGVEAMQRALAALVAHGQDVDRGAITARHGVVERLPAYQWSQRAYWFCEDRWLPLRGAAAPPSSIQRDLRDVAYRLDWVARPAAAAGSPRAWWLLGGDEITRHALERAFAARGLAVRGLDHLPAASDPRWAEPPGGVLDLRAPGPGATGIEAHTGAVEVLLDTLRRLRTAAPAARLWTLTQGAQDAAGSAPAAASLWGAGRSLAIEHAGSWGGLIDVPADRPSAALATALVEALQLDDGEDQLRIDAAGQVSVARLVEELDLPLAAEGLRPAPHATALVAGPRSRAVQAVLHALRERGAGSLVWLDTGNAADSAPTALALPDGVRTIGRSELPAVIAELAGAGRPIQAAVCFLASSPACALDLVPGAGIADVFRRTAEVIDPLVCAQVDELLVVSSVAGAWGSMAMAMVGAAAAYVDALLRGHRAAGRAYAVLESTPWADGDLVDAASARDAAAFGVEPLAIDTAIAAVLRATAPGGAIASRSIARIDWPRLRLAYEVHRPRPVLGGLGRAGAGPGTTVVADAALLGELRELAGPARLPRLQDYLRDLVARLLRHAADAVATDAGFFQLGMDSIMALELRRRLAAAVGIPVPASVIFEHPTVSRLARYVLTRVGLLDAPVTAETAAAETAAAAHAQATQQMLADAAAMSEQELLAALAQELE